jgi:hypothetical protein
LNTEEAEEAINGNLYRQVFGVENKGTKFGSSTSLSVKIDRTNFTNKTAIDSLKRLGVWNNLQTNSILDYLNITAKVNFT